MRSPAVSSTLLSDVQARQMEERGCCSLVMIGPKIMRHEALVRREALETDGGASPPRRVVAAAW
jgi:hypothetical protein